MIMDFTRTSLEGGSASTISVQENDKGVRYIRFTSNKDHHNTGNHIRRIEVLRVPLPIMRNIDT